MGAANLFVKQGHDKQSVSYQNNALNTVTNSRYTIETHNPLFLRLKLTNYSISRINKLQHSLQIGI